ncbi:MAG: hypothetical protein ACOZCL_06185 [Bacillota bacterium]
MKKTLAAVLKVLLVVGMFLTFNVLIAVFAGIGHELYYEIKGISYYDTFFEMFSRKYSFELYILVGLNCLVWCLIVYKLRGKSLLKECSIMPIRLNLILPLLLLGFCILIINAYISRIFFAGKYLFNPGNIMYYGLLRSLLLIGILGLIFEEIIFRGIIFNILRKDINIFISLAI